MEEKRAVILRQATVMATINFSLVHLYFSKRSLARTNDERVNPRITRLDLFHRNILPEHPLDK